MTESKIKNVDGLVGEGAKFERIRRITGYLIGTIDRFNDAKASEVRDRVNTGCPVHADQSATRKETRGRPHG